MSFTIDLDRPVPYITDRVVPEDKSEEVIGKGLMNLAEVGLGVHKQSMVKDFESQLAELDEDEDGAVDGREAVLREMAATDRTSEGGTAKLAELGAKLAVLSRAEKARRVDLTSRKQALIKQWKARDEWLAPEITAVAKQYGVGGVGKPSDPLASIVDPITKEITKYTAVWGTAGPLRWAQEMRAKALTTDADSVIDTAAGFTSQQALIVQTQLMTETAAHIEAYRAANPGKLIDFDPIIGKIDAMEAQMKAQAPGLAQQIFAESGAWQQSSREAKQHYITGFQEVIESEFKMYRELLTANDDGKLFEAWRAAASEKASQHLAQNSGYLIESLQALGYPPDQLWRAFQPILENYTDITAAFKEGSAGAKLATQLAEKTGKSQNEIVNRLWKAVESTLGAEYDIAKTVTQYAVEKWKLAFNTKMLKAARSQTLPLQGDEAMEKMTFDPFDRFEMALYQMYSNGTGMTPNPAAVAFDKGESGLGGGTSGGRGASAQGRPPAVPGGATGGNEFSVDTTQVAPGILGLAQARTPDNERLPLDITTYRPLNDDEVKVALENNVAARNQGLVISTTSHNRWVLDRSPRGAGSGTPINQPRTYAKSYTIYYDENRGRFGAKHEKWAGGDTGNLSPEEKSMMHALNVELKNREHMGDWRDLDYSVDQETGKRIFGPYKGAARFNDRKSFIGWATGRFNTASADKQGLHMIQGDFVVQRGDSDGQFKVVKQERPVQVKKFGELPEPADDDERPQEEKPVIDALVEPELMNVFPELPNLIPPNVKAYMRYKLGMNGDPIDAGDFDMTQRKVMQTAINNAIKDGRSYITYDDYPKLKTGMTVAQLVGVDAGQVARAEVYPAGLIGKAMLLRDSYNDPTLAVATTLGVFRFAKSGDGHIITDTYDFDKVKSQSENPDAYWKMRQELSSSSGSAIPVRIALGKVQEEGEMGIPKITPKQMNELPKAVRDELPDVQPERLPADVERSYDRRATIMIESSGRKDAVSPSGKHFGILQMGAARAKELGVTDPTDPKQALAGYAKHEKQAEKKLAANNLPVNGTNIYILWQQGMTGGTQILKNQDKLITELPKARQRNMMNNPPQTKTWRNIENPTAGDWVNEWRKAHAAKRTAKLPQEIEELLA